MSEIIKKCTDILKERDKLKSNILVKGNTILGIDGTYDVPAIDNLTANNIKKDEDINHITGTYVPDPTFITFYNYTGSTINLSGLNTSNIGTMGYMFYECNQVTSLDLSNFDTSNVEYMGYMFYDCKKLASLNISNFNTDKLTNMQSMFYYCKALTTLDLSSFNTKNVVSFNMLFSQCTSLTSLDLSNFDTSNVTNMYGTFNECTSLQTLDISSWTFDKVGSSSAHNYLFDNVPANCKIYVKDEATVTKLSGWDSGHTYTVKS